jgi:short-subunit dehydrogenase
VKRVPAGSWALVTGASSGIGEAFARNLAARGIDLLLVARTKDALERLAADLRRLHAVGVEVLPADLTRPEAAGTLFEKTEGAGRRVGLLVNNAGFGLNGPETDLPLDRVLELLRLNVVATAELTHRFLVAMKKRGEGAILNVASTAAFLPAPYFAAYSASKAFVLSFTHALHEEVRREGVTVTCLCPGYTKTAFHGVAGMRGAEATPFPEMSAERVAEIGLNAVERGRAVAVTHPLDRAWIEAGRFAPRSLPPRLAAWLFKRTPLP